MSKIMKCNQLEEEFFVVYGAYKLNGTDGFVVVEECGNGFTLTNEIDFATKFKDENEASDLMAHIGEMGVINTNVSKIKLVTFEKYYLL